MHNFNKHEIALKMGRMAKFENCQIRQKFLLTVGGSRRLVGCGQISLASNSKASGLNEAIPSQVWCNKLILLKDFQKLICLPSKAMIGCSI